MDNRLQGGDMLSDFAGDVQTVHGLSEIVQRALLRLTMRKGSFPYQPDLGSTLYRLDTHKLDAQTVRSAVEDALRDMEEVNILDVEQSFDADARILYLTVYLRVNGQDAVVEWQKALQ